MITLSSDFGWPYPASMKGVILQETEARLVDVSHQFPRQDVRATGFWLREVLPYFPPAVHLVVVDPGVGTDRAAIVIRAGDHALVGPDNGVLLPAARELAHGPLEVFEVTYEDPGPTGRADNGRWPPVAESSTFHGRDVFAPAAARVHAGGVDSFETQSGFVAAEGYEDLTLLEPTVEEEGAVGEAITVDGFGNVITNIPGEVLADRFGSHVKANGVWASARRAYAEAEPGHRVVTVGSHGNVELAVNQGRGDETFGVDAGGRVRLSW
ncbi:S-adenosyl-l-methionine hydroxide adenosyltransferase [Halobacteriales archaeon SW_10_68_16]|jgi:S-adenosylmethionine hydrolase|nr:MAG: S-adenosyl-l-methionine hydroxide adenosyltransferase [Halobacteriales archaeon SW_10_68_16]